ncbi:MAG: DUF5025 domain-containing protein [Prevotella sp.]|nr:DUF5025 domain-containing protein [Prevotella sp.]
MKKLFLLFAIACMGMLASCSDDDENETKLCKYGMFEGNINGDSISIQDREENYGLFSKYWSLGGSKAEDTYVYWSVILHDVSEAEKYGLSLYIVSPVPTTSYLVEKDTETAQFEDKRLVGAHVWKSGELDVRKTLYVPDEHWMPLWIYIDVVRKSDYQGVPLVEGRLDGVLYNIDNPQDSMIIRNAKFGIY